MKNPASVVLSNIFICCSVEIALVQEPWIHREVIRGLKHTNILTGQKVMRTGDIIR